MTLSSRQRSFAVIPATLLGKAGEIYYVWQEVKMGVFAVGSKLHLVDEEKGQAGVKESKLVK